MTSGEEEGVKGPEQSDLTDDPKHVTLLWRFGKLVCKVFTWLYLDLQTYGIENVPEDGGVLLIANHQSYLDPILVAVRLKRPVSFFAKSELFENKFFGGLIRNLHAFPVRQGAGDIGAVRQAVQKLKEGHVLNLYPEGSRTEDGNLLPIQPGVALIAKKAGVPIVPVVVEGSFKVWPCTRKFPKPGRVKVLYGPALNIEGLKGEGIVQRIDQTFHSMLEEVRKKP